ncbi:MAG: hypothetical protein JSV89_03490 [Spirochaetaceae bacterium]|nr:MAG: hypothetical protein JSV89_03490 [Spirochaetaceae bacterium]
MADSSVGFNFSMHLSANHLYMIYPSLDALSLNLVSAEISSDPLRPAVNDTTYLDRISYSPDIDENFGSHLFLSEDRLHHILYIDRESEESSVLKWLSKTDSEENWWIDAVPGFGKPLVARADQEGSLQTVIAEGSTLSLYRLTREGHPEPKALLPAGTLRPRGDVSVVRRGDYWAFTVYDDISKRLYVIHHLNDKLEAEPIYPAGAVHYSTIVDGRLLILLFQPAQSSIALLDRALIHAEVRDQQPFDVKSITLCEGTTSVFLTTYKEKRLFLFNERVTNQQDQSIYQLALLRPESAESKYEKRILVKGEDQIQAFAALKNGDLLYVLYLRGGALILLSFSLAELEHSP